MRSAKRLSALLGQCRPLGTQLEETVGLGGACIAPWWAAGASEEGLASVPAMGGNWTPRPLACTQMGPRKPYPPPEGAGSTAGAALAQRRRRPWTAAAAGRHPPPRCKP